ncbi:MAG: hypothetical protein P8186_05930 [Anaerolineae bacterium]|jgi:hypothetical protein
MDRCLRADRLVGLVEDHHVPGRLRLEDGEIILTAPFAANDEITMPFVVTDQPHTSQRIAAGIDDTSRDVAGCPGTTRAGLRQVRLGRAERVVAI